jgi:Mor family transcriptional regulator
MNNNQLPASMDHFVAAVGASATLSIIRVFGGGRLYIPKPAKLDDSHPLVRLLGSPLATRLSEAMGGEMHDIATATTAAVAVRNREIRTRFQHGTSVRQLAVAFGLSKRTIWHVIRDAQNFTPDTAEL